MKIYANMRRDPVLQRLLDQLNRATGHTQDDDANGYYTTKDDGLVFYDKDGYSSVTSYGVSLSQKDLIQVVTACLYFLRNER